MIPQHRFLPRTPTQVAVLAVLAAFCWQATQVYGAFGGNWTALFYHGELFRLPPGEAATTYVFPKSAGYDGQAYRWIARDPVLPSDYSRYIDDPRLRYRRILVPGLAHLLGAGQPGAIEVAYEIVILGFVGLGVYWTSAYLATMGLTPVWGLVFLATPGSIGSLDRMLVDGALTALFAGFLYATASGRTGLRDWVLVAAPLSRDTGVLLVAAAAAEAALARDWRRAFRAAACALPAACWSLFVSWHTAPSLVFRAFTWPGSGILSRALLVRQFSSPAMQIVGVTLDSLALAGYTISLLLAIRACWSGRRQATGVALGMIAMLALMLGHRTHMSDPYGYGRPVSPLLLWAMLNGIQKRSWLSIAAPLAVGLPVAAYGLQGVLAAFFRR